MAEKRRILHKLKITEISGVDNPCQEGARMTIMKRAEDDDQDYWKRDFSSDQRQALADKGQAMPDGSYPIATTGDLKNAIQSIGRAKNYESTRRHIIRRAKALGATDSLPDTWKFSKVSDVSSRLSVLKSKMAIIELALEKRAPDAADVKPAGQENKTKKPNLNAVHTSVTAANAASIAAHVASSGSARPRKAADLHTQAARAHIKAAVAHTKVAAAHSALVGNKTKTEDVQKYLDEVLKQDMPGGDPSGTLPDGTLGTPSSSNIRGNIHVSGYIGTDRKKKKELAQKITDLMEHIDNFHKAHSFRSKSGSFVSHPLPGAQVSINSPKHPLHGKLGTIMGKHPSKPDHTRVNVGGRTHTMPSSTIKLH